MSDNPIVVKHNKHRIHPCANDKKLSLLNLLITQNSSLDIIVAASKDLEPIKESLMASNVKVLDDKELLSKPEVRCELLISYDLPSTAIVYMARLAKATESAIILLDIDEQKQLYPIETLLGRVIKQDIIAGFEYEAQKMKIAQKPSSRPRDGERSERKPFDKPKRDFDKPKRDGDRSERKPFDKPKRDFDKPKRDGERSERKPFDKPKRDFDKPKRDGERSERKPFEKPKRDDKKPNKFLGKDENGKAIFSDKSRDRNHRYDGTPKERYEAPKNVGRKITIKERKPKEDPKPNS